VMGRLESHSPPSLYLPETYSPFDTPSISEFAITDLATEGGKRGCLETRMRFRGYANWLEKSSGGTEPNGYLVKLMWGGGVFDVTQVKVSQEVAQSNLCSSALIWKSMWIEGPNFETKESISIFVDDSQRWVAGSQPASPPRNLRISPCRWCFGNPCCQLTNSLSLSP